VRPRPLCVHGQWPAGPRLVLVLVLILVLVLVLILVLVRLQAGPGRGEACDTLGLGKGLVLKESIYSIGTDILVPIMTD
jgi:hypothetical protein